MHEYILTQLIANSCPVYISTIARIYTKIVVKDSEIKKGGRIIWERKR